MSKVLVTGAGGYIGTQLVKDLVKNGNTVTAVDRFFLEKNLCQSSRIIKMYL